MLHALRQGSRRGPLHHPAPERAPPRNRRGGEGARLEPELPRRRRVVEAFNRPGGWDDDRTAEVALSLDDVDALAAEIDALERDCAADVAAGFLKESPEKLRRRVLAPFRAGLGLEEPVAPRCNAPWVSTVIEADGAVRPCFFQPAYGNLRDGAFDSVVNGAAARSFRDTLDVASNPILQALRVLAVLEAPLSPGDPLSPPEARRLSGRAERRASIAVAFALLRRRDGRSPCSSTCWTSRGWIPSRCGSRSGHLLLPAYDRVLAHAGATP
jgi:hypothetical protein